MPTADLQNSALWDQVYAFSKNADWLSDSLFTPMEEVAVPTYCTSPLLAIYADSNNAPPTWHSAGWMRRQVAIGITVGNNQNTQIGFGKRILLRRPVVAYWDTFGESYKLSFQPHKWLTQISVSIWEFKGQILDPLQTQIDAARIDILRVEKITQFIANRDIPTLYQVDIDDGGNS